MCVIYTCLLGCVLQALENKKHYLEWSDYTRFLRHLDALRQALYAQRRALGEPQNHSTPNTAMVLQASLRLRTADWISAGDEDTVLSMITMISYNDYNSLSRRCEVSS